MLTYPNIFTAQSKEFSQDAFIDWLLRCADPGNPDASTRVAGRAFIRYVIRRHNAFVASLDATVASQHNLTVVDPDIPINEVLSQRQFLRIDVMGRINGGGGLYIIFENKLGTDLHDNQLASYRKNLADLIVEKYPNAPVQIIGVYYKVLEEKDYTAVRAAYHYSTLSRQEMRDFLSDHTSSNPIIHMYHEYLDELDQRIHQWRGMTIAEMEDKYHARWGYWSGWLSELYQELKMRLKDEKDVTAGWGWINNVAGGFHGLWMGNWANSLPTAYLQCDERELKVRMSGRRTNAAMHEAWDMAFNAIAKAPNRENGKREKARRMQHNAQSAEIGNLGSYIIPDQYGKPSIPRTADYLMQVFETLKDVTTASRSRSDIPPEDEQEQA